MTRDYKPRRTTTTLQPSRRSGGGTVLGIFIGLVVGILIALAVVWYMNRTPAPFVSKVPTPPTEPVPGATAKSGPSGTVTTPPGNEPAPLSGKPGDPPPEKRFQFYDILPGKSEPQPAMQGMQPKAEAPKAAGGASLQIASFQNPKDADNLKASLVLIGVEPTVQPVMLGDKQWYRVRVGPFAKFEDLNKVKGELAKAGYQATVIKAGE